MDSLVLLKHLHVTCAGISFVGFFLRGLGKIRHAAFMQQRWVRIAPHLVDTTLLLTAIAMVMISQQYPGATAWINAKIIGLLVYIGLGTIVIKARVSDRTRLLAWLAALTTFIYIVGVAITRNPMSFLS